MAGKTLITINTGDSPNSRTGDSLRTAFLKINSNFDNLTEILEQTGLLGVNVSEIIILSPIKGNVLSEDNTVLINTGEGKVTVIALPDQSRISYEFKVNFDSEGNVVDLSELPEGWTWSKNFNVVTVNYVVTDNRTPKSISYWGATDQNEYRFRVPTAGYPATRPIDGSAKFSIDINAAVSGSLNGSHSIVSVVF